MRSLDVRPHQPQVLRSADDARVIVLALPAGETLEDHQVHEHTYLVVVDGEIEITQGGQAHTVGAGFLAHFEPAERRAIRARGDARLLLVRAPWPGAGHPSARAAC